MVYGMATDDAHVFKDPGNPMVSGPGRGWVMVRAPRLEAGALMPALERGDFYASTGVVLDDVTATERNLAVKVKTEGVSKYRVQFIGRGGQILDRGGRTIGHLHVQRRRGLRPRKGHREQRPDGLGAAGLRAEPHIVGAAWDGRRRSSSRGWLAIVHGNSAAGSGRS